MKITGIIGKLGSGKTLSLAILSYHYYRLGYHIYTNVQSLKIKYGYIDEITKDFYKDDKHPKLLAIDEIYLWLDSRLSSSKRVRTYGYIIMQSRKNGFDVVYTTNYYRAVDVRIRNLTDYVIETNYKTITKDMGVLTWDVYDRDLMYIKTIKSLVNKEQFNLYDTYEKIGIPELNENKDDNKNGEGDVDE
ncbi:MAG: hypothetical protein QW478_08395 [Candidatus Micrarchaeaceae archaeon]